MVSLRSGELHLLVLRGLFATEGCTRKELALQPGQVIETVARLRWEVPGVAQDGTIVD